MEINYPFAGISIFIVICLIIYLIRRNRKDQTKYEKEANEAGIEPEKHEDDKF